MEEHLLKDKNSVIFQHVKGNINCFDNSDISCFKVIDTAESEFKLKLKESIHIEWNKPSLNKQVKHINLGINV